MSEWGDFAVVIGAATASLLGLLFVAVSFRGEILVAGYANRIHFLVPTLIAVLVGGVVNARLILVESVD